MQLKLSKSVGKNSYPTQTDVAIVQTCLANIKVKTKFGMKPIWQGKVDGKNSRELTCAIETFEAAENLRVTGRMGPNDQTWNRLKQKTPTPILDKLTKNPFLGDLPNDHIFKEKQEELKRTVSALSSLPHMSAGPYIEKFWKTLKYLGDPIADLALDIHFNRGLGVLANRWLKSRLGDEYIKQHPPLPGELEYNPDEYTGPKSMIPVESYRRKQNDWVLDYFRRIQIAIAVTHWNLAAKDNLGVKGNLNKDTISEYHHLVFAEFGLPANTFGGSIFDDTLLSFIDDSGAVLLWCKECDKF